MQFCCNCSKTAAFTIISIQAVIAIITLYISTSSSTVKTPYRLLPKQLMENSSAGYGFNNSSTDTNQNKSAVLSVLDSVGRMFASDPGTIPTAIGIKAFPDIVKTFSVRKFSAPMLPRVMKEEDYNTLMRLVHLTTTVLEENKIPYVLAYGSLLGSYLMHDILPWDDDVDIFIHNDTKAKVMNLFKDPRHHNIMGYHYHQSSGRLFKIFFNSSKNAGSYVWKWPFIDLVSYTDNGKDVHTVEKAASGQISVPKTSFFPFHKRPFGPLWLNAPRDPSVFLKRKYRAFKCRSGFWDHQHESMRKVTGASCSALKSYYPFVQRTKRENRTLESLMLDEKVLYEVLVEETFRKYKSRYGW